MNGRLTISLGALAENYARLRASGYASVAGVVKADGYGLGAVPVAERLWREGCRDFFVATREEGVELRRQLSDARIFVLEGATRDGVAMLIEHALTPVLNTVAQINVWTQTGAAAAVHVDTGMQRLGLAYEDALSICPALQFPVHTLVTHMARADQSGHASIAEQRSRIERVFDVMRSRFPDLQLSISNSAGLWQGLGPEHLGRAGIGLYGGNPFCDQDNPQLTVVRMEARVLQLREIAAGVPVGYGGTFVSKQPMTIATIGVGYADGVPRLLSNRGRVYAKGRYLPIVGRVSMDLIQVDATGAGMVEDEWVEVMGRHVPVDEIAEHAQTISYEVLTGLGRRLARSYIEDLLD